MSSPVMALAQMVVSNFALRLTASVIPPTEFADALHLNEEVDDVVSSLLAGVVNEVEHRRPLHLVLTI
jgi:hypothetical protein